MGGKGNKVHGEQILWIVILYMLKRCKLAGKRFSLRIAYRIGNLIIFFTLIAYGNKVKLRCADLSDRTS